MNLLKPLSLVFRSFNTASNVYLAGQVSYWAYKQMRTMQKEKLRASDLRERFIFEYRKEYDTDPPEELVIGALKAYNAVERPLEHRIKNIFGKKNEKNDK